MQLTNTPTRYGAVSQTFHWLTVLLVGAAYVLHPEGPENTIHASANASALSWHETCGILVLPLLVMRLIWRVIDRAPDEPPMPTWMLASSRIVHWTLYALLAIAPLAAIFGAWYAGHPIILLGISEVGPRVSLSHDFGRGLAEVHGTLGNIIIALAFLHAGAALIHHFVLRDRVLQSMLPARARGQTET